jgi:uncharacterized protein YyaL (SSP411 family)
MLVLLRNATDVSHSRRPTHPKPIAGSALDSLIQSAVSWICHSQDVVSSGGVGSYDFSGWSTGYPEVTGYIIPTMWDCAQVFDRDDIAERAVRMTDWALGIQHPQGGWEGGNQGDGLPPLVFNTGQVMRGLLRTHRETGDERYLHSAIRAGDWILGNQDQDGSWTTANHLGLKRVYDSYVAAALAEISQVTEETKYATAARRNCNFVLEHQRSNGWFDLCDNKHFNDTPVTHTLCYTADGLLETGKRLGEQSFVDAATRTAESMANQVEVSGYLAGRFDHEWRPTVRWVCLSGSAQLGVLLCRLHGVTGEQHYIATARTLAGFLAHVQRLNAVGPDRAGGIPGSYPIWGPYAPFRYPCWATKYFLDLLLGIRGVAARDTSLLAR